MADPRNLIIPGALAIAMGLANSANAGGQTFTGTVSANPAATAVVNGVSSSSVSDATAYGGNGSGVATNTLDLTLGDGNDHLGKWNLGLAALTLLNGHGHTPQPTNIPWCADYVHNSWSGPLNIGASETTSHPDPRCVHASTVKDMSVSFDVANRVMAREIIGGVYGVNIDPSVIDQELALAAAAAAAAGSGPASKPACGPGRVWNELKATCDKSRGQFPTRGYNR